MKGRVFITGDKHGSFLPLFGLAEKNDIKESDVLMIAGDAGYVWNDDYSYSAETLQQIFPGIIAFIDGNHENHQILNDMPISIWNGGKVHQVGERLYHLMRGEIYSIYGSNFFTFGGARSNDKDRREEGTSWWREEEPTDMELEYGKKQLSENLNDIDYIVTHETPMLARSFISRSKPIEHDYCMPELFDEWYRLISNGARFIKWYFGHMHVDQDITPTLRALHNDILVVEDESLLKWA